MNVGNIKKYESNMMDNNIRIEGIIKEIKIENIDDTFEKFGISLNIFLVLGYSSKDIETFNIDKISGNVSINGSRICDMSYGDQIKFDKYGSSGISQSFTICNDINKSEIAHIKGLIKDKNECVLKYIGKMYYNNKDVQIEFEYKLPRREFEIEINKYLGEHKEELENTNNSHNPTIITRSKIIKSVVITKDNILELINKIFEYDPGPKGKMEICISITSGEEITWYRYRNRNIDDIFQTLSKTMIDSIDISCFDTIDKNISIVLKKSELNYIIVHSTDENWVNGTLKSFDNIVSNWKRQEKWPYKYGNHLVFLSTVLSMLIIFVKMKSYLSDLVTLIIFLIIGIMIFIFSSRIMTKVRKLYPPIEIITGPEYQHVEEMKRKKLRILLFVFVIPNILTFLLWFYGN